MSYNAPGSCPVCGNTLMISKLTCTECQTRIEGEFTPCKFCQLPNDQLDFIEVFLKCRGNIKDVERELGISYPTVRNKLEGVLQALGFQAEKQDDRLDPDRRTAILARLEMGEITPKEAAKLLRKVD